MPEPLALEPLPPGLAKGFILSDELRPLPARWKGASRVLPARWSWSTSQVASSYSWLVRSSSRRV